MKEKVLITGASGFVGFHLLKAALNRDLDVHAGIRENSAAQHLKALPVTIVELNYEKPALLEQQLKKGNYQYIIHAAGATRAFNEEQYNKINAGTTTHLLNALQHNGQLKKFVFISSLAAVGPLKTAEGIITENTVPDPVTAYGRSKLLAETIVRKSDMPWVIVRPTAVYGPREKDLLRLIKAIIKGWDVYIGKIDQQLSFVYVDDLANAVINALYEDVIAQSFNISDGNIYTRYDWADTILKQTNQKARRIFIPLGIVKSAAYTLGALGKISGKVPLLNADKLNELAAINWASSIANAAAQLQFRPVYDLRKGLTNTIEWYQQNKWL